MASKALQSTAPSSKVPMETGRDEAQLVSSLARLQELHIQLRRLRDAVPSMIRPMHAEHPSPETVYVEFSKAATGAVDRIQIFSELLRDGKTQDILAQAKEKSSQDGDGVMNWLVSQHADWLEKPALDSDMPIRDDKVGEVQDDASRKQPAEILQAFKDAHDDAGVEIGSDGNSIKYRLHPPTRMTFNISWKAESAQGEPIFSVDCEGPGKLQAGVLRALASRPEPGDLYQTLDIGNYICLFQPKNAAMRKV